MAKKTKAKRKPGRPPNCKKCRKPQTRCKCGRPTKMTKSTLDKLRYAFAIGCDVTKACAYADIHNSTYYKWAEENPDLISELERLREKPILKALATVDAALEEDYEFALKYLERTWKEKFSLRQEVTGAGGEDLKVTVEFVDGERKGNQSDETSKGDHQGG